MMNRHIIPGTFPAVFQRLALAAAGALLLASCSNLSDKMEDAVSGKDSGRASVSFSLNSSVRTLLPTSVDTSTLSFILSATAPEGLTAPDALAAGSQYPSMAALQEASFSLDAGNWTFSLKAYKNPDLYQAKDTDEESENYGQYTYSGAYADADLVLTGSKTVAVHSGPNTIDFDMQPAESGTGSISLTLKCYLGSETCSSISSVTATLYDSDNNPISESYQAAARAGTPAQDSNGDYIPVIYENLSVPKGSYMLMVTISLQYDADDASATTSSYYTTDVTVEPGTLSAKTEDLTKLNQRYTITYKNVDVDDEGNVTVGDFTYWTASATPVTSYNPNSTQSVMLPSKTDISRSDKSFVGWYESYNTSTGVYDKKVVSFKPIDKGSTTTTATIGTKTYYAKWGDLAIYVSGTNGSLSNASDAYSVDEGGTISQPYASLTQALTHINSKSSDNQKWIVYVDGSVESATVDGSNFAELTISGNGSAGIEDVLKKTSAGSVLTVSTSKPVVLQNLTITGGKGAAGAGLSVGSGADVTLDGVIITGNDTQSSDNDNTERNGGGISNNGTLRLKDCEITDNNASGYGGGIFNQGTLFVYGSTLIGGDGEGNTAGKAGGGIDNDGSSRVYIGYSAYSSETDNTPAPFTGSISYNTASATAGGGIYNQGTFILRGGAVSNNGAPSGAGIYNVLGSNVGKLHIIGTTLSGNTATGSGGGLWSDGTLTVTDATFSGNSAANGAGMYAAGTLTIGGSSEVTDNTASANGGGIYVADGTCTLTGSDSDSIQISGNTAAAGNGGGLYITGSGTGALEKASIVSNSAAGTAADTGLGGAIYHAGTGSLTLTEVTVGAENAANDAVRGGGIYNAAGSLTVTSGTIAYNRASASQNAGGGIYNASGAELFLVNGSVDSNAASADDGNGGGVYNAGTFTMSGSSASIVSNTAAAGGGVYIADSATFTMSAGSIGGNTAVNFGGGVYNAGDMFMYESAVVGDKSLLSSDTIATSKTAAAPSYSNYAPSGGGIYNTALLCIGYSAYSSSSSNSPENVSGGIYYNSADNGGAIVNASGANLYIRGGNFKLNYAAANGGAIYNGGTFIFTGGTITRNKTAKAGNGGGVYNAGVMNMYGSAVIGNAEAGAAATASSYANFAGNGAGIYNAASTGATTGILVLGDASEALTGGVYYNYANADGGGVFNAGNFAISSGYILYNAVAPDDETTVYAGVRKGDTYTNSINGNGEVQSD